MVVARKLKQYLEENGVKYTEAVHPTAFTAQEVAATAHIHGKEVAKVVILNVDGKLIMAVVAAPQKVNLEKAKAGLGAQKVHLAKEEEFKEIFPDCDLGAEPPFGNLYSMETVADPALWQDQKLAFNAGTHTAIIWIALTDWERLVKPRKVELAGPISEK